MRDVLTRAQDSGFGLLVGGVRRGEYTMPKPFVDCYTWMERVLAADPPRVQPSVYWSFDDAVLQMIAAAQKADADAAVTAAQFDMAGPRASAQFQEDWLAAREAAAEKLLTQAGRAIAYRGHELIAEHIQPVLAERLKEFTADLGTIGAYWVHVEPVVGLLLETVPIRKAWHRWYHAAAWYVPLRQAWSVLRRHDPGTCEDPMGVESLFAEVRNAPAVVGDWRNWRPGYLPQNGWPNNDTKSRLSWIVQHGGQLWAPTAVEQHSAYGPHAPRPLPREAWWATVPSS